MKQYLVCKCLNDDEYAEAEYTPSHFILEITPEIVKELEELIKDVQKTKKGALIDASFTFWDGTWAQETEWLIDTFEEELVNWEGELEPIEDHPYTTCERVKVDRTGELRFIAYAKYSSQEFYTCTINFQKDIKDHLEIK